MVSSADTGAFTEGQTLYTPGNYSFIPSPKTWSNGDDLLPGTLNREWRDTFNWLLRKTSPAFSGYNSDSFSYTANAAIALKVEDLKRGNLVHTTNDTKVTVYEPGWYMAVIQVGGAMSGATGTVFSSVLKINGSVYSTGEITRAAGNFTGIQHLISVPLNAADYVEIALAGPWTGTASSGSGTNLNPRLDLWWRNNL